MYKCINCDWEGLNPIHKNHKLCPVCGDNTEEWDVEVPKLKPKKTIKKSIAKRLKDIRDDLMDDGKLNHSNNPNKKSPGRKKGNKR